MTSLGFKYGGSEINLKLPGENVRIIESRSFPGVEDPQRAVSEALEDPFGTEPMGNLLSPGDKVSIIVDDITRDTPVQTVFPAVLRELKEAGVKDRDVNVVLASGTHKRQGVEDLLKRIGGKPSGDINLLTHDPLDKSHLSLIGFTSLGTPVWINDKVAESDFKIGIGGIRPHPEAGFGGGGKIILPGVSAWEAVGKNHVLFLSPKARIGVLEGNPFREDIEECAEVAGLDFIVNTVLNVEGRLVGVFAGDHVEAHREGVKVVRKICENVIGERADILIMAFGPKDETVWQVLGSAFTISVIDSSVKKGGTVLLLASCEEGVYVPFKGVHHMNYYGELRQTKEFVDLLASSPSPEEMLSRTIRGEVPYMELGVKGVIISQISRSLRLVIVSSNLKPDDVGWFGELAWRPERALDEALKEHGKDTDIVAMPDVSGPKGCPSMKPFPYIKKQV